MEAKQVVIGNLLVNYYVAGTEKAAPAVIFLHGWRSEGRVWGPVIEGLSPYGRSPEGGLLRNDGQAYNSYALDLPGFGKSERPREPFTVGDYVGIVRGFIEKVVLSSTPSSSPPIPTGVGTEGETIVVGHSFGGRVAIKLAADKPDLIQKLVLVDSAGIRVEPPAKLPKKVIAKILRPFFSFSFMQPLRARLYRRFGAKDYVATPELKQTFLNVINEDLTPFLRQISIPTLIVWGENDREVPLTLGQKMHSLIPNSRLIILKNAGHFSFVDKTKEFVKLLQQFLSPGDGERLGERSSA